MPRGVAEIDEEVLDSVDLSGPDLDLVRLDDIGERHRDHTSDGFIEIELLCRSRDLTTRQHFDFCGQT